MRVEARRALLIDSAIGFALAITSWMASFYVWERSEFGRPERRHSLSPHTAGDAKCSGVGEVLRGAAVRAKAS